MIKKRMRSLCTTALAMFGVLALGACDQAASGSDQPKTGGNQSPPEHNLPTPEHDQPTAGPNQTASDSDLPPPDRYHGEWVVQFAVSQIPIQASDIITFVCSSRDPDVCKAVVKRGGTTKPELEELSSVKLRHAKGVVLETSCQSFKDWRMNPGKFVSDVIKIYRQSDFMIGQEYLSHQELNLVLFAPVKITDACLPYSDNPRNGLLAVTSLGIHGGPHPAVTHFGVVHANGRP